MDDLIARLLSRNPAERPGVVLLELDVFGDAANFSENRVERMTQRLVERVALGRALVRHPQVFLLDEPVVVVGHRRDVDHAFDEVLDQLDEQAERGHAG